VGRATPILGLAARPASRLPAGAQAVTRQLTASFGSVELDPPHSEVVRGKAHARQAPAFSVQVGGPGGVPRFWPATDSGEESPIVEPSVPVSLQPLLGPELNEVESADLQRDASAQLAGSERSRGPWDWGYAQSRGTARYRAKARRGPARGHAGSRSPRGATEEAADPPGPAQDDVVASRAAHEDRGTQ
jgi:hypothetical protein